MDTSDREKDMDTPNREKDMDTSKGEKSILPEVAAVVLWIVLAALIFFAPGLFLAFIFLHPVLCSLIYRLMERPSMWSCLGVQFLAFFLLLSTGFMAGWAIIIFGFLFVIQWFITLIVCAIYRASHKGSGIIDTPEDWSQYHE